MVEIGESLLEVAKAQQRLRIAVDRETRAKQEVERARYQLRLARDAERAEYQELMFRA